MNSRFWSRILLPLALSVGAWSLPAHGQLTPLPQDDADQVRTVIVKQIQAMAEADAERVFETTTPAVRAAMGTPNRFLAIMLGAYPMVTQADAFNFHPPQKKSDGALQLVEIRDSGDKSWLAIFMLEQQPDKSWRISGCAVMENPWLPV